MGSAAGRGLVPKVVGGQGRGHGHGQHNPGRCQHQVVAAPGDHSAGQDGSSHQRRRGDADTADDPVITQGQAAIGRRGVMRDQRQTGRVIDAGKRAHRKHGYEQHGQRRTGPGSRRRPHAANQVDQQQPLGAETVRQPTGQQRPQPERQSPGGTQRPGVLGADVELAADQLLDAGERQLVNVDHRVGQRHEQDDSENGRVQGTSAARKGPRLNWSGV